MKGEVRNVKGIYKMKDAMEKRGKERVEENTNGF